MCVSKKTSFVALSLAFKQRLGVTGKCPILKNQRCWWCVELNCGNVSWDAIVFCNWSFLGFAGKWVKLSLLKHTHNVKSRLNPTPTDAKAILKESVFE